MKSITLLLTLMLALNANAESLVSYIVNKTTEICEQGQSELTLAEVSAILSEAKTNEIGCQIFDIQNFQDISQSEFTANDDYQGPLVVLKILDNQSTSLTGTVISLRDKAFCMDKQGENMRISYSLSSTDTQGALRILGEKSHSRRVIFHLKNGELQWVGQHISNYERSGLRQGSTQTTFQCGK